MKKHWRNTAMTKEIELTQGKYALVDDEDYDWLNKHSWHAHITYKNGEKITFYAARGYQKPIRYQKPIKKTEYMHRLILGPSKGKEVDHINGNSLDNRKSNLRIVTHRQNSQNLKINRNAPYPGICWYEKNKKWGARIRIKGKRLFLGLYDSPEKAFKAYSKKCEEIGEEVLA